MWLLHSDISPDGTAQSVVSSPGWWAGYIGSAVTAITFLAVAVALFRSLNRTRQWSSNPLGVGTLLLFITCGGGHLVMTLQLSYAWLGIDAVYGAAARVHYLDWHLWVVDGATAAAGLTYWTMRRSFPNLVSGTAVYEDLRKKHRHALEIHDNVVQGLVQAKMSLDLDRADLSQEAMQRAMASSRKVIEDLVGKAREAQDG